MAYDEKLAERVRELIVVTHKKVEPKKMFAGLCFMVNGKMCIAIHTDKIMVRFDPAMHDSIMQKPGCSPMDFTGKVMKGYVFVNADVIRTKKQLDYWVQLALAYNAAAKSSKKPAAKKAIVKNKKR